MLARWISILGNYEFEIEHRKGSMHLNADSFSRKVNRKCKRVDCETCSLETRECVCVVSSCQTESRQVDSHLDEMFMDSSLFRQQGMRHDFESKSCVDLSLLSVYSDFDGQVFRIHKSKSCDDLRTLSNVDVDEFGVWSFVLFNDAWSQKGHSASNTTVILA